MAGRKPSISDEEILYEIAVAPDPFVVAPELTDALGMTRQGVLKRLNKLAEEGHLGRKETGAITVFWLSDSGREIASDYSE